MREILRTEALPRPRFRYSSVVCAQGFAFVSGLIALHPSSGQLADGGAGAETRQILDNFLALLAEQGWSLDQVVLARIFCSDFADFSEINGEWEKVFGEAKPPARTSVGVQHLPLRARVEIEFQIALY